MGNEQANNFKVWPLMPDELAPPEPPKMMGGIEDDTIISYGSGEYTFGLTLAQQQATNDNNDYHHLVDPPHHTSPTPIEAEATWEHISTDDDSE